MAEVLAKNAVPSENCNTFDFEEVVAVVAEVAEVAEVAFPVRAPTKLVDVTEVNPASVVDVPPNRIAVVPIVTSPPPASAVFGMPVKFVPVSVGVDDQFGTPATTVRT
jgi:hypothetical protein